MAKTPVEALKFDYVTTGALHLELLLTVLQGMETKLDAQAHAIESLRTHKSPGAVPYVNPEAH